MASIKTIFSTHRTGLMIDDIITYHLSPATPRVPCHRYVYSSGTRSAEAVSKDYSFIGTPCEGAKPAGKCRYWIEGPNAVWDG